MIGITKLLKSRDKIRSFSIGYCKHEQKNVLLATKLVQGRICNTLLMSVLYYLCLVLFLIFIN